MAGSQDSVEHILKEIHLFFANCSSVEGQPNLIVVNRKAFMELLDRLNRAIFEMMNRYEQTQQSRAQAEREFQREADTIVDGANRQAEDIYAASMIYTQDMLGSIRDLIDKANDSIKETYVRLSEELGEKKNEIRAHETELVGNLNDLRDTEKYLSIIEDINSEKRKREREAEAAGAVAEASEKPAVADAPEIQINKNAPYFKWKAAQVGEKAAAQPEIQDKTDA